MIGRLVRDAYRTSVDVETASRHLWRFYHVAGASGGQGAHRMLVSALAAVLLFVTTAVTVVLSGDSLPGDSLYLVKRGAERVHLMVSFAPESDARLHLRIARTRAVEAQRVATSRPDRVPHLLSEIVAAFEQASLAGGAGVADEMELLRGEVSTTLSTLNAVVDPGVAASVDAALGELGGGRAVSGTEDDPEPTAEPTTQPASEPATQPTSEPTTEPTLEPTDEPSAGPGADVSPGPVELSSPPVVETPADAATEQPGGRPGAATQEPPPQAPGEAGSRQDTAIPVLDDLEGLLDEPGTDPGP